MNDPSEKPFTDTSVVIPLLTGRPAFKQYLSSNMSRGHYYVSTYVRMEYLRATIINLVNFYAAADMEHRTTISDTLAVWREKFEPRQLKVGMMIGNFLLNVSKSNGLDIELPQDKNQILNALIDYIARLVDMYDETFTDVGQNPTGCARGRIELHLDYSNISKSIIEFGKTFNDIDKCRSLCHIDKFILGKERSRIDALIAGNAKYGKSAAKGYHAVIDELLQMQTKSAESITCNTCKKIGDAVLALSMPKDMRMEHIDYSFDALCEILELSHHRHLSVLAHDKIVSNTQNNGK